MVYLHVIMIIIYTIIKMPLCIKYKYYPVNYTIVIPQIGGVSRSMVGVYILYCFIEMPKKMQHGLLVNYFGSRISYG